MKYLHRISPFRWLLLVSIGLIYIWGMQWGGVVREQIKPSNAIFFTIMMVLHFSLYCVSTAFPPKHFWFRIIYLSVQGLLVFLVSFTAQRVSVTIGLYLALLGEVVSFRLSLRLLGAIMVASLLLFSLNIAWLYGWESVHIVVLYIVPILLLVIGYALLFMQQAQARAQAQALLHELEVAHEQLADYAVRIEELTRLAERRRMARELHDTLAQGLAGLILQLEAVKSHLVDHHHERALEIVTQAMGRARTALAGARGAIDNLRIETSTPANLQQAVETEIDHFTTVTGIACTSHLSSLSLVPDSLCEDILRIIAEGLTNVAQHAQAQHVWVEIVSKDGFLTIEVRDNGCGFDTTRKAQQNGHYGLLGLRERAKLLGGQFTLSSVPGEGTILHLSLPENKRGEIQ